ncbi:AbgT family transporter [Enterovibrio nigricans]|uniref:Aminobenzoyl-glutamate transport protein n=1 Tax=Enterovibrio nigricans DSM 22720 TaxID=1121868 RepID=A0A1T4UI47_9GAMM|nr:AbgT family transporter [Enterovibrio nigricans]PKF50423.1 aminobenzoyl-glutamate transporter [Enterovibrio nigricans]SKA52353.1 aminobenzoyl-glutamate transport protein [Enterovibrio nigricans DSM 22720]
MATQTSPKPLNKKSWLDRIENVGNKIPDITMLFLFATLICIMLSMVLSQIQFDYIHPLTNKPIQVVNLFTSTELMSLLSAMVSNFVNFPPLGIVIVATLGIGIAEGSGYITTALRKLLAVVPMSAVTPSVIFIGILAHVASDSAYVVLMPVSAYIFYKSGKHPLAGIAAGFAGLAGGFTASYTPSIIDPILAGFTESAAQVLDPTYVVNVLCNFFYSFASTFAVIGACWYVTDKIVEPRLKRTLPVDVPQVDENSETLSDGEARAFRLANWTLLGIALLMVALMVPESSLFRAPDGSLTSPAAPAMKTIVPMLLIFFTAPGLVYGFVSGKFKTSKDVTKSMESITASLISFIVFAFFCAQFLYCFSKSNIGSLIALSGAEGLKALNMPGQLTIFGVILLTAVLNIIITSASSKWAILAPVLVPMLMAVGISPELTQAAFRISDSAVNVSTPMFAFYPLIISYMQRYSSQAGIGTLVSMMLPYTVALLFALMAMLYLFWGFNIPLGFNSGYTYGL